MRTKDIYRLELRKIRLHAAPPLHAAEIGLPSGLQSTMYNIANMVVQTALNSFGTDTMAAWTAFEGRFLLWMISSAFGVAITTFVGQNYGAGKIDRMKRASGSAFVWILPQRSPCQRSCIFSLENSCCRSLPPMQRFFRSVYGSCRSLSLPMRPSSSHRDLLRSTSRSRQ